VAQAGSQQRAALAGDEHAGEPAASRSFLVTLLVLTFVMNMLARGVTETFAVFLLPVQKGLGISRADITLTYSVYMLAYGLSAPFAGQLIDRLGARITYAFGLTTLGLGYVLAGSATELWHYLLTVGLLGGLGSASLGMIVASGLLSRWFTTRIGAIMALPYAAIGAGMLILPPLTQLLLTTYDWRTTHRMLGTGVLLALPLVMLLPLGRMTAGSPDWRALRLRAATDIRVAWTVSTAVLTTAFWGLFAAYLFTSVAAYSVLPHSVAYLVEQGFNPLIAASAFGMTGMLSAAGILAVGWLSDRFGRLGTVTVTYFSHHARHRSADPGLELAFAAAGLWLRAVLWPDAGGARPHHCRPGGGAVLGWRGVGAIYGTLSLAMGLGAAIGSWSSGLLYVLTGSYVASFLLAIGGSLAGLATFWLVGSLREEKIGEPHPARQR
jgi:MFS family permease